MRLRERTGEPDPQAERELEAIDAALAGRPVDPDLAGWAELAEMLSEERPEADPDWSAELDQAVEQRFPRRPDDGRRGFADFASAIGSLMPRRMTPAVAGLATLAVVAVVAAATLSGGDGDDSMVSSDFQSLESQGGALDAEQMPTTSDDAAASGDSSGELAAPSAAPDLDVQSADGGTRLRDRRPRGRRHLPRHHQPQGGAGRDACARRSPRGRQRRLRRGDRDHPRPRRHRRVLERPDRRRGRHGDARADRPDPEPRRGDRPPDRDRRRSLARGVLAGHHPPLRDRAGRARGRRG